MFGPEEDCENCQAEVLGEILAAVNFCKQLQLLFGFSFVERKTGVLSLGSDQNEAAKLLNVHELLMFDWMLFEDLLHNGY
jgi:hypothetical protein